MQQCRAPLHFSFLSHLQITAALLTESKSKSNFPSWKWFSIDPHPELIGFMSCLCRNQIKAGGGWGGGGVREGGGKEERKKERTHILLSLSFHVCLCVYVFISVIVCTAKLVGTYIWQDKSAIATETLFCEDVLQTSTDSFSAVQINYIFNGFSLAGLVRQWVCKCGERGNKVMLVWRVCVFLV